MKKDKVIEVVKSLVYFLVVFILIGLVFETSYSLFSNSVVEQFRVDKTTINYLSFNYADKSEHVLEVDKPKILGDFRGKHLLKNNYFDFEISIPSEYVKNESVTYEIIVEDLGNEDLEKYVKFYLTDQNNKPYKGFENGVPVYSAFTDVVDGKVIYSGEFSEECLNYKFRLRIWVSNKYKGEINDILAYHIQLKIK